MAEVSKKIDAWDLYHVLEKQMKRHRITAAFPYPHGQVMEQLVGKFYTDTVSFIPPPSVKIQSLNIARSFTWGDTVNVGIGAGNFKFHMRTKTSVICPRATEHFVLTPDCDIYKGVLEWWNRATAVESDIQDNLDSLYFFISKVKNMAMVDKNWPELAKFVRALGVSIVTPFDSIGPKVPTEVQKEKIMELLVGSTLLPADELDTWIGEG